MTTSIDELKKLVARTGERLDTLRNHLDSPKDIAWESLARIYTNDVITLLKAVRETLDEERYAAVLKAIANAPDGAAIVIPD